MEIKQKIRNAFELIKRNIGKIVFIFISIVFSGIGTKYLPELNTDVEKSRINYDDSLSFQIYLNNKHQNKLECRIDKQRKQFYNCHVTYKVIISNHGDKPTSVLNYYTDMPLYEGSNDFVGLDIVLNPEFFTLDKKEFSFPLNINRGTTEALLLKVEYQILDKYIIPFKDMQLFKDYGVIPTAFFLAKYTKLIQGKNNIFNINFEDMLGAKRTIKLPVDYSVNKESI